MIEKQPIAVTMKSFCPLFSKSGVFQRQSLWWDFKGQSPLTPQENPKFA